MSQLKFITINKSERVDYIIEFPKGMTLSQFIEEIRTLGQSGYVDLGTNFCWTELLSYEKNKITAIKDSVYKQNFNKIIKKIRAKGGLLLMDYLVELEGEF